VIDPRRVALVLLVAGLAASISLAEVMLAVLALWLLGDWIRGDRPAWPLAAPMLAFASWTAVTALASPAPVDSLNAARSALALAAIWVVRHAVRDAGGARWFATALLVALAIVAALSVVQVTSCGGERLYAKAAGWPPVLRSFLGKCARAHGFYSIYMTLGGVLALILVLSLPRLAAFRYRAAAAAAWLVGVTALALTFVRGAWLGFAAGVAVLACTVRRRALLVGGVLCVATALLAVPGVLSRALSIADVRDPTVRERLAMWSVGLALVREHPVLGVGPGQVKRLYPAYAPDYAVRRHTSHLHNTPLQVAAERGLVGLALWLWLFAAFFVRAGAIWRRLPAHAEQDRALLAGCVAAVAAFLVAGLFEYNFGDTEVLLVAMNIMALPFVIERDHAVERG
jgi:hypothetical protein